MLKLLGSTSSLNVSYLIRCQSELSNKTEMICDKESQNLGDIQ